MSVNKLCNSFLRTKVNVFICLKRCNAAELKKKKIPLRSGLLRFDRAAQDLQPPGPVLRRAPDPAGHPGGAADRGGALWLLEALGEADRGGVTAAPLVQAGPAGSALLPVQTGRHPPANHAA